MEMPFWAGGNKFSSSASKTSRAVDVDDDHDYGAAVLGQVLQRPQQGVLAVLEFLRHGHENPVRHGRWACLLHLIAGDKDDVRGAAYGRHEAVLRRQGRVPPPVRRAAGDLHPSPSRPSSRLLPRIRLVRASSICVVGWDIFILAIGLLRWFISSLISGDPKSTLIGITTSNLI